MANNYLPHILILPEDRANEEMAIGFGLDDSVQQSRIKVLPPAGGWRHVLDLFEKDHVRAMGLYVQRYMVLLLDFDRDDGRFNRVKDRIPVHLKERVFILGVSSEPEDLRGDLGSFEEIGKAMAKDCREQTLHVWGHKLLRNNQVELLRLRGHVSSFVFASL